MKVNRMNKRKLQIGIIGDSQIRSDLQYKIAYEIGQEIAHSGSILICGGRGGVMLAATKGAYDAKGISIGILPAGVEDEELSPYLIIIIKITKNVKLNRLFYQRLYTLFFQRLLD